MGAGNRRGEHPGPPGVLRQYHTSKLTRTISGRTPLDIVAEYATWRVHQVDASDVLEASSLEERHTLSFWDALIVVAARRTGASVLLSEDLQAGRAFGALTVQNPFAGGDL